MSRIYSIAPALFTVGLLSSAASGATIPLLEDFNDGVANGFADPENSFTENAGAYDYATDDTSNNFSLLEVTNADGIDFTMSVDFDFDNVVNNGSFGLVAFADSTDPSSYYLLDVSRNNTNTQDRIRIIEVGGDGGVNTLVEFGLAANTEYSLTIDFASTVSGLEITSTISDGTLAGTETVTGTDATPLTGDYFGFRIREAGAQFSGTADNFELSVIPEPASLLLLGMGGVLLAGRRRR